MARLLLLQTIAVISLFTAASCQVDDSISRLCNTAVRCSECIIANPLCVWCSDPDYNGPSRCYAIGDPDANCNELFEENPQGMAQNQDEPTLGGTIQVTPASIDVNVRPGSPVNFGLTVQPANNFPVDIYLLMDLSFSMNDDLANLKRLGAELAEQITMISTNFRVGFGSFVEKRLAPFVSLDVNLQNNPCPNDNRFPDGCVATYSYRHHISLTDNEADFNAQVQAQNISGNQDSPEGGFDGFLQSIVCTQLIGWRDVSRKLLLYITDAGFHIAGDGKLGGVILPHDGNCHMDQNTVPGDYNEWDLYDYPSIGQIAQALRTNDIIPIFAAQEFALPAYQSLVRELGEGAFSGTLDRDSGNIVELVRDSYNNISQRIVFDRQLVPPGVSVDVTPVACPGDVVNGICTGVQIENNATFQVSVTLQECIPGQDLQIPIRVVGFGSFTINLGTICTCDCENMNMTNSPLCNNNGTQTCGRCECNPGRFGELCQCDGTGQQGLMQECPLGPTEVQCTSSDRGTCICGECQCRRDDDGPLYFGPACECDREGCPSVNDELCSGRGVCTCDGCRCSIEPNSQRPYLGDACECTPDISGCLDPENNTDVCNGIGVCGCDGVCDCSGTPYIGQYCDFCSGADFCAELNCDINEPCAQCAITLLNSLPMNETSLFDNDLSEFPNGTVVTDDNGIQVRLPAGYCPEECMPDVVIINRTQVMDYEIQGEVALQCPDIFNRCFYRYYVGIDSQTGLFTEVHVEYPPNCPGELPAVAAWAIAVGIILALLVAAVIALILLKIFLVVLDAIEVRRFEKELASTKYSKNTNPLYRSATQDYKNPIYGQ